MPLTKNKTLTYLIKSVKITDLWDAEIEVAELDGATELRRVTVTASANIAPAYPRPRAGRWIRSTSVSPTAICCSSIPRMAQPPASRAAASATR